jgi:hypothetical protein
MVTAGGKGEVRGVRSPEKQQRRVEHFACFAQSGMVKHLRVMLSDSEAAFDVIPVLLQRHGTVCWIG